MSMFKYIITGYGCNGAGESEQWNEYTGTNREDAITAYKKAKDWMGGASVNITVLGREWQKEARWEAQRQAEMEAEADYYADFGPDVLEYADGTLAFDDNGYGRQLFEASHGQPVAVHPYRDYNRGIGVFADKFKGECPESLRWLTGNKTYTIEVFTPVEDIEYWEEYNENENPRFDYRIVSK